MCYLFEMFEFIASHFSKSLRKSMTKIEVLLYPDGRLDRKNAARYLGLSPNTLACLASRGHGPRYIKRGRIFYFQADLDVWLREGERLARKPR